MAEKRLIGLLRGAAVPDPGADVETLARFVRDRDDRAFEQLVRQLGPMVLATCRRVLGDEHAAEDAFQAAFLLLARKAIEGERIRHVGGWLHATACRVALALRRQAAARTRFERTAVMTRDADDPLPDDAAALLDEELARLPEKYRLPIVLYYLRERTQAEAADELGVSVGTLNKRLARGRDVLLNRLSRRGVSVASAGMAAVFAEEATAAVVHPRLIAETVRAASGYALGHAVDAAGPLAVIAADKGASASAWKVGAALGAIAVAVSGVALAVALRAAPPTPTPEVAAASKVRSAPPEVAPTPVEAAPSETHAVSVAGLVLGADGKPVAGARVAAFVPAGVAHAGWIGQNDVVAAAGETGADGRFRFDVRVADRPDLPDGPGVRVAAWVPGKPAGTTAPIPARGEPTVTVRLPAGDTPKLRVLTPDVKPAAGVRLRVTAVGSVRAPAAGERQPPFWPADVVTDDRGRAVLDGVAAGQPFAVAVVADGFARTIIDSDAWGGDPRAEPEVRLAAAKPFDLRVRAGDTEADLAGVRVWVAAVTAGPLPRAAAAIDGETGADGRFRVPPLPAGAYRVFYYPPPGSPYLPVAVNWKHDGTGPAEAARTVWLPRGVVVTGRVRTDAGAAVAGARVSTTPVGFATGDGVLTGPDAAVLTDRTGRFTLATSTGTLLLLVHGPSEDYVAKAVPEDPGFLPADRAYAHAAVRFDLDDGAPAKTFDLRVTPGSRVRLRVTGADDRPATGIYICRSKQSPKFIGGLKANPVENGTADVAGLDPAREYPIIVLDKKAGEGGVATLPGRAADPVAVKLGKLGSAEVKLVGEKGKPLAGVTARLAFLAPPDRPVGGAADKLGTEDAHDALFLDPVGFTNPLMIGADGSVKISGLVPGVRYRVYCPVKDIWTWSDEFTVRPGETRRLPDLTVRTD